MNQSTQTIIFALTFFLFLGSSSASDCCIDGYYRTQTDVDWGMECSCESPSGLDTACIRDEYFSDGFPDGLLIGCPYDGFSMLFTNASSIYNYLPQTGAPLALSQNYIDPGTANTAGIFGSQVTALALTLGFEQYTDDFSIGCDYLGDLYVCDTPDFYHPDSRNCFWYYNWTVMEIYEKAEVALSGVCNATIGSCSAFSMNDTIDDNGDEDASGCGDGEHDYEHDERHLPLMDSCLINNLNDCVTYINTAFQNGQFLWRRPAFSKNPCE